MSGVWAAPGRVNLIGEHTDYSGGLVLPMALPQCCRVTATATGDGVLRLRSRQLGGTSELPVTVAPGDVSGWPAYGAGVVWALRERGFRIPGAELELDSGVPIGAGLSSSAAVGCAVALALRDLFDLPLTAADLAAVARRSENDFAGAPTGVMDQMVSMLARAGHLLFLDTRSMRTEQVPFDLAAHGLVLLVIETPTRHDLADGGGYASRRAAVEAAARRLGVDELRDAGPDDVARIADPVVAARARHVVTENARVERVVGLLRSGADPRAVGPLLTAGHASLRDDFEISTPELDTAVAAALAAGAHGARMTGGGFGGSALALVDAGAEPAVRAAVDTAYAAAGFAEATIWPATPSAGARRIR